MNLTKTTRALGAALVVARGVVCRLAESEAATLRADPYSPECLAAHARADIARDHLIDAAAALADPEDADSLSRAFASLKAIIEMHRGRAPEQVEPA